MPPFDFVLPITVGTWSVRRCFDEDCENFLTLPSADEGTVLAKNLQTFLRKFSVPNTHWRSNLGLAENFGNFLPSLPIGHEKCVWTQIFNNFYPLLLFEDRRAVLTKKSYFYMKFLSPSFTWEKCQPPLPTGGENVV